MTLDQAFAYQSTGLEEADEGPSHRGRGRLVFFLALAATVSFIKMKRHRSRSIAERD